MKILYRIAVIIFNLCLLFSAIITPALLIASNEEYYHDQFEKNGIYSHTDENGKTVYTQIRYINENYKWKAAFTDEQLDELISHIVNYLFTDMESFYLEMDNVMINGETKDDVPIFGETAVLHMKDVKTLMQTALWGAVFGWIIAASLLALFIIKRQEVSELLLKYTLVFYVILLIIAILFCLWTLSSISGDTIESFSSKLWENMHHLLFPFQPEKFKNSFFNDTLTHILTLELFLDAVSIVLAVTVGVLAAWFGGIIFIKKKTKQ